MLSFFLVAYSLNNNSMIQERDYLIVGQGLAGTLMHFMLQQAGKDCLVIDEGIDNAASAVAAGIINPVTGRRYVKSWKIDALLPFARKTYAELEAMLGNVLVHDYPILRAIGSVKEENDWLVRAADPDYERYMLDEADLSAYAGKIAPAHGYGEVVSSLRVDIATLVKDYRAYLQERSELLPVSFDPARLELFPGGVSYEGIQARGIIFCEGYRAASNPFFDYLPFHGDKGEVLLVRIPGAGFDKLLKQHVFVVPLGDDLYWIGTTYFRNWPDLLPTPDGKAYLVRQLTELLQVPFEIVDHRAAVRPTVRDRKPFLGACPHAPQVYLFNGLGTKGTSLGPYWADHLRAHLLEGTPLDKEVDILRFAHLQNVGAAEKGN
jgi:glycine/D-amino acid oxidase-like deaminating enzyme